MDDARFDALVRRVGTTIMARRHAAAAGVAALLLPGGAGAAPVAAEACRGFKEKCKRKNECCSGTSVRTVPQLNQGLPSSREQIQSVKAVGPVPSHGGIDSSVAIVAMLMQQFTEMISTMRLHGDGRLNQRGKLRGILRQSGGGSERDVQSTFAS